MIIDSIDSDNRIQDIVDQLALARIEPIFIMGGLMKAAVILAQKNPETAISNLEGAVAALTSAIKGFQSRLPTQ